MSSASKSAVAIMTAALSMLTVTAAASIAFSTSGTLRIPACLVACAGTALLLVRAVREWQQRRQQLRKAAISVARVSDV